MKRFFLLLAVLFLFGCRKEENKSEYYNADGSLLTWEQARDLTEELWSAFDFAAVSREILPSSTRIPQSHMQKPYYSPAYDSWVVVMSPNPLGIDGFQFYHYVFVNAKTGTIYIDPVEREFDNEMIKWHSVKLPQLPSNTARFHSSARTKAMTTKIRPNSGNDKWAIIINGGGIKESNYVRYWNHCSALYNILVDKYAYQKSHIYLAVSDGTSPGIDMNLLEYYYEDPYGNIVTGPLESSPLDYDGDGQPEQNIYSATKNSVQSVFSTLGQLVGTDDDVFIFVTDHGERENNISYITLWNNARLSPAEFNNELQKLHNSGGRINIMMGQCFSGGFIDSINQTNISITTSVSADEAAKARTDLQYSEYLYYWLSAMNGSKIDDGTPVEADTDDLVGVSFYEAYQSAKKADQKGDHPLYKSIPSSTGVICTLGYDQFVRPIIIGADKISSQHGASYSIQNLPDGANVTWLPGPGLVGPTSSIPANFRYGGRKIFEPSYISASISIGWITFQLHKIPVDCWGCGNYEASDYLTGGEGVYQISLPAGAYGFTWGCDSNWEPLYQGRFYVDFETKGDAPSMIWCDYTTPLGDAARAYRYE